MKKLALILGLLAISSPAFSATWIEYNSRTNNTTIYYDQDSVKIKKLGNGTKYIEVWEKIDYSTPQLQDSYYPNDSLLPLLDSEGYNKYYSQAKYKTVYDCWNDKTNLLYVVRYDNNGNSVYSNNWGDIVSLSSSNSWNEVIPDSIGEGKLQEICRTYRHQLK